MAADTRYKPPTKVVGTVVPLLTIVMRLDPNHQRETHREPMYEFTKHTFYGDNSRSGAYSAD